MSKATDIVTLNVGGHMFTTTRATLCRFPCSMLGSMFSGKMQSQCDINGAYFIDRDGSVFIHVLNFLRSGKLCLPTNFEQVDLLAAEVDFYQIEPLVHAMELYCKNRKKNETMPLQSRKGVVLEVIETRTGSTATMPTRNSRVKTILSGLRHVISSLPSDFVNVHEKVQKGNEMEFTEVELYGSNIRLQLADHLRSNGWHLLASNFSSSSGYDANSKISSLIIEHSYRDQWLLHASDVNCDSGEPMLINGIHDQDA